MITTTELRELTEKDEKQYELADQFIEGQIKTLFDKDITCREFRINRTELNEHVEGLRAKVRQAIDERYSKGGWKVAFEDETVVFAMKKRGGRRKKSEIEAEAAAEEAAAVVEEIADDPFAD